MTKHNYKQSAYYLIYLIRCVLHNRIPAKEKLDRMDLSGVFAVAKAHSLAAIAAYALESAEIHNKAFEEAKNKAIRKNIILDVERESVLNELEKSGIWYMPLKGSVLKDMYPQIGMREMADNDILFDASRSSQVKAIMESLGFTTEHFGGSNHDVYQKPPVCNFEMHNALFSYTGGKKLIDYYSDVNKRLEKDSGNRYGYHFANEDFYIYITAHEYKHFSHGGTGLRNLVDRYVFLNRFSDDLDMSYIEAELSKIDILDYEKKSRNLAQMLFNGVNLNAEEKQFLDYHIFSGTYGTTENLVENRIKASGGGLASRIRYGLDRFIGPVSKNNPSYKAYAVQYPAFYKHKLLLPLLPFYRLIRSLKNSRKRIITEIRTLLKLYKLKAPPHRCFFPNLSKGVDPMPMHLFEHNQTAYNAAVTMLAERGKAAVIHPTGTGKSFIGFKLCEDNPDKTICWLSPSRYIYQTQLENLAETSEGYQPENVKFYTYAKLMNVSEEEIAEIKPDYIILDEFHRCGAEFWGLGVDKLLRAYPNVPVLGLSATAIRYLDNQRDMTDELFDGNVASEMTLGEAIVCGILNPPKYVLTVYSYQKELERYETKIAGVKSKAARDEAAKYLETLRRTLEKADGLDKIFEKHIENKSGKYIVFCSSLEAMNSAAAEAKKWFVKIDKAPHIYKAYSNDPETSKAFADFKADKSEHLKLLYCIDMLNEGIHVEDISGVILLRPTVSPIIYKQQIGRALSASKATNAVIFDIVNNIDNLYSIDTIKEEMQAAITYYRYTGENRVIIHDRFEVIDEVRDCRELFDELEGVLSASWDIMYEQAEEYYKQNGDLLIPATYHTEEGYALGRWLTTQRLAYAGKTDKPLTQVQIDKLEAIGVVWDSHLDFIWNRYFEKAKEYYEQHGDLNVPKDYVVDGLKLGIWILRMRMAQANQRDTVVTPEKKTKLDSIGMIWSLHSEQWERNYLDAMHYYNEHGSLYMDIKFMTESGFKLGYWVSHLRQKRSELTKDQISRLDAIGMVWNTEQFKFDEGLRHAQAYLKEFGSLSVPTKYVCKDGYALGKWLNLKRRQYANGRLSKESSEALEKLGMVWKPTDDKWDKMFAEAQRYYSMNGDLDVPVTEKKLYSWLGKQRIAKENGKLTAEQISQLESIGMIWDKAEYNWLQCFNALKSYFALHSTTQLPYRYIDENGLQLFEWLTRQKRRYRQGKLPMRQTEQLRSIGVNL